MKCPDLSQEQLNEIAKFIEEEEGPMPSEEAIVNLQSIFFSLQRKLTKSYLSAQKHTLALEHRLKRVADRQAEKEATGNIDFTETNLDSVDVANALIYCLQKYKVYRFTKNKVIYILYEMYASWLASKQQRLFIEHPVCTEYGPQFWRVYKRINVIYKVPDEAFKVLAEQNPGVAKFCQNAAQKYYDYNDSSLVSVFKKSQAYKNALPTTNGGKWNKEINDSDIFVWKIGTR